MNDVYVYKDLVDQVFQSVRKVGDDQLVFTAINGDVFMFYHDQDCCEAVWIEDIIGDLNDLVHAPLIMAEEVIYDRETPPDVAPPDNMDGDDCFTWTFYKFATHKGYVTVRWYGTSNGYYSESVHFKQVKKEE